MSKPPLDPVALSQTLIRCPSITPVDAGALDVLQTFLESYGFSCRRKVFEEPDTDPVDNLYARIGGQGENFCFAGHTDVVPPGDETLWTHPPFAAEIHDEKLFGRGTTDMKCAVAAFAVAAARLVEKADDELPGSISLLITGDEEGVSINGTRKMLQWLETEGETLSVCLVGEPTNPHALGEMAKIGRRGSMNMHLTVKGTQGHAAYPHMADNPIPHMVQQLSALIDTPLDDGTKHFQPSTLTVTTVDVGNPTSNVIPSEATARFNIRFNDSHTSTSVEKLIRDRLKDRGTDVSYDLTVQVSGESFLSPPGRLSAAISTAVQQITGKQPELSTTGGTSDARFIKDYCPVAEFGMISDTAHKTDEYVLISDIFALTDIYELVVQEFFRPAPP